MRAVDLTNRMPGYLFREDGEGDDSPFALSFAKRIVEPGVEINKTLRFLRQDVLRKTGNHQEPFVYGSLPPDDFYFVLPK